MTFSSNVRQNRQGFEAFTDSKSVSRGPNAHPSPTPFAPSSPLLPQFQCSSALREARNCRGVSVTRSDCLDGQSPQVHTANSANTAGVKAVPLYARPAQVLPQHQLPHENFQVSNDNFSCIPVRAELAPPQAPQKRSFAAVPPSSAISFLNAVAMWSWKFGSSSALGSEKRKRARFVGIIGSTALTLL